MINRRNFLKGMIGSGVLGLMPAPFLSGMTLRTDDKSQPTESVQYEQIPKERRIYYLGENTEFYLKLYRCVLEIDCEIFSLRPYSADMMSLNGFIYIIDRNFVGRKWWDHYVRCCNKYNWNEPCLIIDNIKDMEMPKSNYIKQFDLNDPSSISSILYIIKEARAQNVFRRLLKV